MKVVEKKCASGTAETREFRVGKISVDLKALFCVFILVDGELGRHMFWQMYMLSLRPLKRDTTLTLRHPESSKELVSDLPLVRSGRFDTNSLLEAETRYIALCLSSVGEAIVGARILMM